MKFYMYNNKLAKKIWIYIEFIPVLEWILIVGIIEPIGGPASSWGRTVVALYWITHVEILDINAKAIFFNPKASNLDQFL